MHLRQIVSFAGTQGTIRVENPCPTCRRLIGKMNSASEQQKPLFEHCLSRHVNSQHGNGYCLGRGA